MTRQAENCIDLLSGNSLQSIQTALKLLSPSVKRELREYYEAEDDVELADKIYLLG